MKVHRMGMRALGLLSMYVATLAVYAPTVSAQSIASRVARVKDGTVRMAFASRPDVCGNGRGSINTNNWRGDSKHHDEWTDECEPGPVRVAIDVADGHALAIRTYVGGKWRAAGDATDLGTVPVREAVDYLLGPVVKDGGKAARDAIFPATLADSVITWPRLLVIARDDSHEKGVRTQAVFWVGQQAGEKSAEGLRGVADDVGTDKEVRLSAVFAISQRRDEGVPMLIDIAKTSKSGDVRKQAMFWLGQSHDKRALDYFESVLVKK